MDIIELDEGDEEVDAFVVRLRYGRTAMRESAALAGGLLVAAVWFAVAGGQVIALAALGGALFVGLYAANAALDARGWSESSVTVDSERIDVDDLRGRFNEPAQALIVEGGEFYVEEIRGDRWGRASPEYGPKTFYHLVYSHPSTLGVDGDGGPTTLMTGLHEEDALLLVERFEAALAIAAPWALEPAEPEPPAPSPWEDEPTESTDQS